MPVIGNQYRSLAPSEAQKIGQQLYRRKNYEAALEAFTAAIELSNTAPTSILDNRAATYEKLRDFPSALRDGKRMIQHEKTGARAYLRIGKILLRMDKSDQALNIYEYGLRNVPADDPDVKLLRGMKRKLSLENVQPRTIDPFQVLPIELAEMIIKQLDFRELVRCLGVSKKWNGFLTSMTSWWTEIDLSRARRPVQPAAIRACIRRSKGAITKATLNRVAINDSDCLKRLAMACRSLEHIEVLSGFTGSSILEACPLAVNLKTLLLGQHCDVTAGTIAEILGKCASLERAEFNSIYSYGAAFDWPSRKLVLRTLRLKGSHVQTLGSSVLRLHELFDRVPNLQSLGLINWKRHSSFLSFDFTPLQDLQVLDICGLEMVIFPKLPPTLQTLNMSRIFGLVGDGPPSRANVQDLYLPSLRDLSFDDASSLSSELLQHMLKDSRNTLERLTLNNCPQVDGALFMDLIRNSYIDNLIELQLRGTKITDKEVLYLTDKKYRLRRLDLSMTPVTGVGIKGLATRPNRPNLVWLGVNNCWSLASDAVELAKACGIEMEYKFPDTIKSGKRVRIA